MAIHPTAAVEVAAAACTTVVAALGDRAADQADQVADRGVRVVDPAADLGAEPGAIADCLLAGTRVKQRGVQLDTAVVVDRGEAVAVLRVGPLVVDHLRPALVHQVVQAARVVALLVLPRCHQTLQILRL